jgi:anti-anti-sigma factor
MELSFKNIGDDVLCIAFKGRLDATNASDAEKQIDNYLNELRKDINIAVDLTELEYISSAGLRVLLVITKNRKKNNSDLCLFGLNENVMEIFKISGFDTIFNIAENETEAVSVLKD